MCWAHFALKIKIIIADLSASFLSSSAYLRVDATAAGGVNEKLIELEGVLMTLPLIPVLLSTI